MSTLFLNKVVRETFPSELASEAIKDWLDRNPELAHKYFVVYIRERNGIRTFKIRAVNYNGLVLTARWCRDEDSRTSEFYNNFDSATAPSRSNGTTRSSSYCRGVTSYIPVGALVDLAIVVHDTKQSAESEKDFHSCTEAKIVRKPPETNPELDKLVAGKKYDLDRLIATAKHQKRYTEQFFQTAS
jgi:hypothetical protein